MSSGLVSKDRFPVTAADFIEKYDLQGNMFNHFDWGGYLMWRLSPERKVFGDGRMINVRAYRESLVYRTPMHMTRGKPLWRHVFDSNEISYAVIPRLLHGRKYLLSEALEQDRSWGRVFSDGNTLIYVKK